MKSSISPRLNADLLDAKYREWSADPRTVEPTWASFFEGFQLGSTQSEKSEAEADARRSPRARIVNMVHAFRALGHTAAWIDPLGIKAAHQPWLTPEKLGFTGEDLDREVRSGDFLDGRTVKLREMFGRLQRIYCGPIGFEFMHIQNREVRDWLQSRIEARLGAMEYDAEEKRRVLSWLLEAEGFERFLHRKYVGQKRFSLEGGESLMVMLNTILEACPGYDVKEIVMGMAHRGRLTVLANFLKKSLRVLLYEFSENYVPNLVSGDGDVKYHLGYEIVRELEGGKEVQVSLAANPSHLEAVNSVVEGKARARQRILNDAAERRRVLPLLVHGDAAFAGQGVVAEVLNLSQLPGYRTGGTVHLIINNQIGFTTQPEDARSSAYCSDVAKMIEAPVFHVNGDDALAVRFVTGLAFQFRQKFSRDVIVDMVCYRRHGHNEGDEPAFTQPALYREIGSHRSPGRIFRDRLVEDGTLEEEEADGMEDEIQERLQGEYDEVREWEERGKGTSFMESTAEFQPQYTHEPVLTGITPEKLREIGHATTTIPKGFGLNPKVKRMLVDRRRKVTDEGGPYVWAHAESMAIGSLLLEGTPVRLSGQDSRRGTFSQRHSVFYDTETRERHIPLLHLGGEQAKFCVYNSLLSEAAVLGFDYGYSLAEPHMLIMWEAQFGDFANGAQVVIDQFICSAESKWARPSSIVLLLPHGYEGQGPEHSSARLERFLQLCADDNIQVCNLTTPAQYFHLLRRQVRREFRKPMILMTPKSLLRHPKCVSFEDEFTGNSRFREVLDSPLPEGASPEGVTRAIFCSGKVFYDLVDYRESLMLQDAAIIRLEQFYPFNGALLENTVARYPNARKFVWCQEEAANMGGWTFVGPRLQSLFGRRIHYAGRDSRASPAVGSLAVHLREQKRLVAEAFSL